MADENDMLSALRTKIDHYLRSKGLHYEVNPHGYYILQQGSTRILLRPVQWTDTKTIVRIDAPVAFEIAVNPDLTLFLAEENFKLFFGKFSIDTEN